MPRATSENIFANGLHHRVLRWSPKRDETSPSGAATDGSASQVILLLHGYMDAAGTFSPLAPKLAARGHTVYAPDFRGFGEGPRVPSGAYYHFADYVFDLTEIVAHVTRDAARPVIIVGHSMGGTVGTLYAGSFPERVSKLVTMEGLGPPELDPNIAPSRMRRWIDEVTRIRAADAKSAIHRSMTEDDALARLAMNHGRIPPEILRAQLPHLTRRLPDGRLAWTFDPLHRTPSPTPFSAQVFCAFAAAVTCPTLFVSGGPLGFHPPDEDARLASFTSLSRTELRDAGHMMHWTEPSALADVLLDFIA